MGGGTPSVDLGMGACHPLCSGLPSGHRRQAAEGAACQGLTSPGKSRPTAAPFLLYFCLLCPPGGASLQGPHVPNICLDTWGLLDFLYDKQHCKKHP